MSEDYQELDLEDVQPNATPSTGRLFMFLCTIGLLVLVMFVISFFFSATGTQSTVTIEKGASASEVVNLLAQANIVRSEVALYTVLLLLHNPSEIKAGTHDFSEPLTVFEVARKITNDTPRETLISVTLPEGYTNKEFAGLISAQLPTFSTEAFIDLSSTSEGYLFPDTYFVPADYDARAFYDLLRSTQETQWLAVASTSQTNLTQDEIIILASIIEREANSFASKKMIAGILQNRLAIGMPLQTDASMEYVLNKPLKDLTASDLKIDSPYNTYLYNGLPPTAIGNPGTEAIVAVLEPTVSDYFYYITGDDGVFHYAKNFEEHKRNIARYLK